MFDSLGYAKKLEEVGVPRDQAEAHVRIIADIVEGELVTKSDLTDTENKLRAEISAVRIELKADFAEVRHEMIQLESRMIIKMGAMLVTVVGASTSFLAFLLHR